MPIKIIMIATTIISSRIVKPRSVNLLDARAFAPAHCGNAINRRSVELDCSTLLMLSYQFAYRVPSLAVACDFEYTSKTFFPHQLVESGSSDTHRKPQSDCPVIGSTGTRRRNRIFLSSPAPSLTPLTSVSRSGGYPSLPTSTRILLEVARSWYWSCASFSVLYG